MGEGDLGPTGETGGRGGVVPQPSSLFTSPFRGPGEGEYRGGGEREGEGELDPAIRLRLLVTGPV